ncbi:type II toxin-antitoxin system RelE/ParE family toxin [Rhizobium sp. BT03]|uniref:type II toxin-antitoxin system RelE/ParE family toxin n=1 Tax=Rhizobium sp. BT03 TaxID=3045156 RepID=UPI0024B3CE74|nr:type II toxin-antitoxin system RelE/ParE family toxin [Rhizobium sp. BT03]WHO74260.1 type II toxin-antitoxin system RelE/ParE family toxin [Rhizobium sp. BT03]
MAAYRFYPRADVAQDKIWRDTLERWGETQADAYILGLHGQLQRLCENRLIWRQLPQRLVVPADIKRRAYFCRYEHHYIFLRELENGDIGVMSILHERLNLPVRLREDLAALYTKPTSRPPDI